MPTRHQHHTRHPRGVKRDRGATRLSERILIRADGAARGNPGPAAAGAVLIDLDDIDAFNPDCRPIAAVARPLGIQTNNYAEYTAVILALEKAASLGAREVQLVLDSMLVVEQLAGRWKVKHPGLKPLVAHAHALLAGFERWSVRHERRESNRAADALANLALDDPRAAAAAEALGAHVTGDPGPIGTAAIGAACSIFDAAGRVLLVRHAYGKLNWEIPGGVCLPGEEPARGAERELEEETGLSMTGGKLSGVYFEPGHDFGPFVHFVFRFPAMPTARPVARPPEIGDVGWFALESLPRPMSDFTELRIRDGLAAVAAYRIVGPRAWRS